MKTTTTLIFGLAVLAGGGLVGCIDLEADLGAFAAPCSVDTDCREALVCDDGRCTTGQVGEGEGDPCITAGQFVPGFSAANNGSVPVLGAPVRCITGDVTLSGSVTAPEALDGIEVIDGTLTVEGTTALEVLRLRGLKRVTGDVFIGGFQVDVLDDSGFPTTNGNEALTAVELFNLVSLGGDLVIANNDALLRVDIARAAAALTIGGSLIVFENNRLDGDEVFDPDLNNDGGVSQLHLEEAGGSVLFWDNGFGADDQIVWRLVSLVRVGTGVATVDDPIRNRVHSYGQLEDRLPHGSVLYATTNRLALDRPVTVELPRLGVVSGGVGFNITALTDVELPVLTSAGGLDVGSAEFARRVSAPRLAELTGLPTTRINLALYLFDDPVLDTVELPSLLRVTGAVFVKGTALTDLCGVAGLGAIAGGLSVEENTAMVSLAGLGSVASIGGAVVVAGNNATLPACQIEQLKAIAEDQHTTTCAIPLCN
jgi:hypothetical protein